MPSEVYQILRKIRIDHGLSQENIADELNVDQTTYRRYETGESNIKIDQMIKLSLFYKMTLDQLVNYGDSSYKVEETHIPYVKSRVLSVTVELDGRKDTLDYWIEKLTAINKVV